MSEFVHNGCMFDRTPWPLSSAPPAPPGAAPGIDLAAQRLRGAVVSCDLAPGSVVHEKVLAERFRLGRAAVRIALTGLEVSGFVQRLARQGWRVAPLDGAQVSALVQARQLLEPALARRVLSAGEARTLRQFVAAISAVAGRTEPAVLATARAAERQIRDALAAQSGLLARRWMADLTDHLARTVRALELAGQTLPPPDLGPLVDALAAGDVTAAEVLIRSEIDAFEVAAARALLKVPQPLSTPPIRRWRSRSKPQNPQQVAADARPRKD